MIASLGESADNLREILNNALCLDRAGFPINTRFACNNADDQITMIDSLQVLSKRLVFLNPVAILAMIVAVVGVVYCLLNADTELAKRYLAPCIVALLWAASLYTMINIFPHVPAKPAEDVRFFARLKITIKRFFYRVVAVIFLIASLMTVYVGYQLIKIWASGG